jgi:hypothetical protein
MGIFSKSAPGAGKRGTFDFVEVLRSEILAIGERRLENSAQPTTEGRVGPLPDDKATLPPSILNAVGLSLSGGGIRSAAFCLGVLQELSRAGVLKQVDYLSTVSGGGYVGSSLSAAMSTGRGAFPFHSRLQPEEPLGVKHIRNYSNYLMPHGKTDVLESLVIYLRGLVANVILVLPWLIFAAYITIRSNPTRAQLDTPEILRISVPNIFPFHHFVLTAYAALALFGLLGVWTLVRSGRSQAAEPEVPSHLTTFYGYAAVALVAIAFFELQPFIFKKIWTGSDWTYNFTTWLQRASVTLAPLAGVAAVFHGHLQAIVKRAAESRAISSRMAGWLSKTLIYLAAAVIPLLLWAAYLQLSWWGIADKCDPKCVFPDAPLFLVAAAEKLFGPDALVANRQYPMANLYMLVFIVLVLVSMFLSPNANSLHRLYRDRLSKAFLFDPTKRQRDGDPTPLDCFKLSSLDPKFAPYHLLNTALNIQGSKFVNRRGRNADFFLFSPRFVGSEATGYARSQAVEEVAPELDLGTAMAISAAAASSNMGAKTIRPLTPTLALLNVRIGFWLRNPRFLKASRWRARLQEFFSLYFLYELVANLRETSWNVYVTDGGHLENLGAYELLKRRCRVIIAVDAEADPEMTFGSLVTLERFARIDLGIRIDLPWEEIRDSTLRVTREFEAGGLVGAHLGPHCAVGAIEYPGGERGLLIYFKSSLSGDENDYIANYKSRFPLFPHESTGDQFFGEEQFEAYRALGFHAAHGVFTREAPFARRDPDADPTVQGDLDFLDRLFPRM